MRHSVPRRCNIYNGASICPRICIITSFCPAVTPPPRFVGPLSPYWRHRHPSDDLVTIDGAVSSTDGRSSGPSVRRSRLKASPLTSRACSNRACLVFIRSARPGGRCPPPRHAPVDLKERPHRPGRRDDRQKAEIHPAVEKTGPNLETVRRSLAGDAHRGDFPW